MIQEFSKEIIEINNNEYTLFVNRKGIASWEKIAKVSKQAHKMQDKYKDFKLDDSDEPIELTDNINPFDFVDEEQIKEVEEDTERLRQIYVKFYWIALYENHKLSISEVNKLFEQAEKEYGIEQLIELANQMIEDANKDKFGKKETKKLTALKSTK